MYTLLHDIHYRFFMYLIFKTTQIHIQKEVIDQNKAIQ